MLNLSDIHTVVDKIGSTSDILRKIDSGIELWNEDEKYQLYDYTQKIEGPKSLGIFINLYPQFYKGKYNE